MADDSQQDANVTVKIFNDGPLLLSGECVISDQDGNVVFEGDGSSRVALCRCGGSSTKPMCDGTHQDSFDGTLNPPPPRT